MKREVIYDEAGNVVEENVKEVKIFRTGEVMKSGITFGSCLAMIVSYCKWKSILWAIFHGILSWAYVIYYVLRYGLNS
jgi:hypothetical protein